MKAREPVQVLLVEDDEVDVMVALRAFERERLPNPVVVVNDGIEAFDVLRGTDGREALRGPLLIVLDLNLPRMNGIEFLNALRSDPVHAHAVVFVVTTSDAPAEVVAAYRLGVAGYFRKTGAQRSSEVAKMIALYCGIVEMPAG